MADEFKMCGYGRLSQKLGDCPFFAITAAFGSLFIFLDLRSYESFRLFGVDFGLFDQVVWNSLHGRLFQNTFFPDAPILLGQRFSPILLALAPLYGLYSDPRIIVLLPAFAVIFTAFPLYWYARAVLGRLWSFVIILSFFLTSGLDHMALGQFYEIKLAMPLLMLAGFFMLRRRHKPMLVCLGIALLCKEEVALIAVGFGLYILFIQRKFALGSLISLASFFWFLLLIQIVIPGFQGSTNYYYFANFGSREYGYLGTSLADIIRAVLTSPNLVFQRAFTSEKIEVLAKSFLPLGVFSIWGIELLALSLPTLAYILPSDRASQYWFGAHHYAPFFVFLSLAGVVGLRRVLLFIPSRLAASPRSQMVIQMAIGLLLVMSSFYGYFLFSPGPLGGNFDPGRYMVSAHTALGDELLRSIPASAKVVAQNELISHLSERQFIYEVPNLPDYRLADYLSLDTTQGYYDVHRDYWDGILSSGYFEILNQQDGYIIAKRREPIQPVSVQFGGTLTLLAYTMVPGGSFRGGQTLRPIVAWRADANLRERYIMQVHLVDAQGHVWGRDDREPWNGLAPTNEWLRDQRVQDQYDLHLQHTMPSGVYQVVLRVADSQGGLLLARDASGKPLGYEITLASVGVEKSKANVTAGQIAIENRLTVDFGEMRLLGFVVSPENWDAGKIQALGLYWRARSKPVGDYVVAVQLRDANNHVVFEQAARPANNSYPTLQWAEGEVLLDWHDLQIPSSLRAGRYQIYVVLREATTQNVLGETKLSDISVTL